LLPRHHLERQDTVKKQINRLVVSLPHEHFWNLIGLTASQHRVSQLLLKQTFLGEAKVREQSMTLLIDEDIFRFDVAMHDAVLVKVLDCNQDFCQVNAGVILWQKVLACRLPMLIDQ